MSRNTPLFSSRALRRTPTVALFLEEELANTPASELVIGWGHKETAEGARRHAARHGLSYTAMEDGFLRSLDLGCRGAMALSMVVDHTGIYYDAASPSDLENLLNADGWQTEAVLQTARAALDRILQLNLSKYNHAPDAEPDLVERALPEAEPGPRVLLVDQTLGDASIELGLAGQASFVRMLDVALERYPAANILVKTHPDVLAGRKKGCLTEEARARGLRILATDCTPLSLLRQVDVVFVVTSQMGFEALMLDREVHCFGMPFYAGWGLTVDEGPVCPRRTKKRSFPEIFAAACVLYARYINPVRETRTDILQVIDLLAEQRRQNERNRCFHACLGFRWWKKPYARAYLGSTGGSLRFFGSAGRALKAAREHGGELVVWSSSAGEDLQAQCDEAGVPLVRMEDGFIRSVGLGSDFNWPYSLVVDRRGIYYDPTRPSELEDILNALASHPEHDELCARAARLRAFILNNRITKYNTGAETSLPDLKELASGRRLILVPGQVEDDASVRRGGFGMGNLQLLQAVRAACPDAFIVYKPHPDVESGNRKGAIQKETALRFADLVLQQAPMGRLLELVQEVHTLTSQTGFEALLRGCRVVTYGGPFYAGWGLTEDRQTLARRRARLTLDELVAGTLLLYPAYYDWQCRMVCLAEDVCHRLMQPHGQLRGRIWARVLNALRSAWRAGV